MEIIPISPHDTSLQFLAAAHRLCKEPFLRAYSGKSQEGQDDVLVSPESHKSKKAKTCTSLHTEKGRAGACETARMSWSLTQGRSSHVLKIPCFLMNSLKRVGRNRAVGHVCTCFTIQDSGVCVPSHKYKDGEAQNGWLTRITGHPLAADRND